MAQETFRIEIPIEVADKTDPGVSAASRKLTAFDKAAEKTKKRLDQLDRARWKVAIEAVDKVSGVISKIGGAVKGITGRAWSFTVSAVDKVTAPVKSMISTLGKLLSVGTAVSTVLGGITVADMISSANTQNRAETQLKTVLKNVGAADDAYDRILAKASELQSKTLYGDEAYIAGAAELATYISDTDALTDALDLLANYATGMSNGAEISPEYMTDLATQLGKGLNGDDASFEGLKKKGFTFTDAQEKKLRSEYTSDAEKIKIMTDVINASWDQIAEKMADLPYGKIVQFKNAWGDVKEAIGNKLLPSVGDFFSMLKEKLPGVQSLLEAGAGWLNDTFESLIPTFSEAIDKGIDAAGRFGSRIKDTLSSSDFQEADLFGKIKIAWDKIIAEPFASWWDSTGKQFISGKLSGLGEFLGKGLTSGLLALLGIDIDSALSDGTSIGSAFIEGFKNGFDTEKISEALKNWASDNKGLVIGLGAAAGFNLITGIAGKINELTSMLKPKSGSEPVTAVGSDRTLTCATATVNANIVNVYGKLVNSGETGNGFGSDIKSWLPALGGGASFGGKLGKLALGGGTAGSLPMLGGQIAGAHTVWAPVAGAAGTSVSVGTTSSAFLAALGNFGASINGAASVGGAVAAGGAASLGILGGALGLGSALIDVFQGAKAGKAGDSKTAREEYITAGTKGGMLAAGAGGGALIGAGIGALGGPVGAGLGALIGLGIGGVSALLGGDKAGKAVSESADEGGWLNNKWQDVKGFFEDYVGAFFTESLPDWGESLKNKASEFFEETLPGAWDQMWEDIGSFFVDDVPYAAGYILGQAEVFFTETFPNAWDEFWNNVSAFCTDTVPTWAAGIWNDHIVPFFTESVPGFFSDLWNNIVAFCTDSLPTWAMNTWQGNIVPFFTESVPGFFVSLWALIVGFVTETIPQWATNIWQGHIAPFFTSTVPSFFTQLWGNVTGFVTQTIPSWASSIAGTITGWFSSIKSWISSTLSSIGSSFSAGYSAGGGKHAWGGIMNAPHMAMIAEDGAEAIIPLSPGKRDRGMDLWMTAGRMLGVQPYDEGGIAGDTDMSIQTAPLQSCSDNKIEINVQLSPEFVVQGGMNADDDALIALLREHIREMADDIGDELAERLTRIFSNMPIKGVV